MPYGPKNMVVIKVKSFVCTYKLCKILIVVLGICIYFSLIEIQNIPS